LVERFAPLRDVGGRGLDVLFVGINPGFMSARAGHHFANPANGFWPLLHEAGFTPRRLRPQEDGRLLELGLGVTNLAARATASVSDLTREEMAEGAAVLAGKVRRWRPRAVVFVGLTAYRAFARWLGARAARVRCGEQPGDLEGARVFVVPNPSGRNAHYSYREMRAIYRRVARALGALSALAGSATGPARPPGVRASRRAAARRPPPRAARRPARSGRPARRAGAR
jgi:TDG/mug DNA glycosylase family protein